MNYRKLLMFCFALILSLGVFAQPGDSSADKIAAEKAAFIQNRVKFTPEESEQFWSIYNAHQKEVKENKQLANKAINKSAMDLTDAELEERFNALINAEEKQVQLKKAYFEKLKSFLPIRKIARLYMADKAFNREMLKMIRERRNNQ